MQIVLISPVSPFDPCNGHRLAVLSDVHALLDNKFDLGVIAFTYQHETDSMPDLCPTVRIPASTGGFVSRFARGLLRGLPPSAERLYSRTAREAVCKTLRQWCPEIVIIDDASVASYIPDVRAIVPNAKIILRSHNVMHDVRMEQLSRARNILRPAIAFDSKRYVELERAAVLASDHHWAITDADAARMNELYDRPGKCLTVSVPLERYQNLLYAHGQRNGFVHVGSLDYRRRADLSHFLDNTWPRILAADQAASLTLAGELKGEPIPGRNVTYAGRVVSDADIYGRSRFAVNFQSSPGGVKLKTLTSLAAGRTLLSTKEGVAGIGIKPGREFLDIDQFTRQRDLRSILNDSNGTTSIAEAGRAYVSLHHSRPAVARKILDLVEEV